MAESKDGKVSVTWQTGSSEVTEDFDMLVWTAIPTDFASLTMAKVSFSEAERAIISGISSSVAAVSLVLVKGDERNYAYEIYQDGMEAAEFDPDGIYVPMIADYKVGFLVSFDA